jgi:RNA polymerase subunit RPABC4/transcription elongation factor Spt4
MVVKICENCMEMEVEEGEYCDECSDAFRSDDEPRYDWSDMD